MQLDARRKTSVTGRCPGRLDGSIDECGKFLHLSNLVECREAEGMSHGVSEDKAMLGVWLEDLLGPASLEHPGLGGSQIVDEKVEMDKR